MKDFYTRAEIYHTLKRGVRIVYPETAGLPDYDLLFANLTHVLSRAIRDARENEGPFWEQNRGGGSKHSTYPLETVAEIMNQVASQPFSKDRRIRNLALKARVDSRVLLVAESFL